MKNDCFTSTTVRLRNRFFQSDRGNNQILSGILKVEKNNFYSIVDINDMSELVFFLFNFSN